MKDNRYMTMREHATPRNAFWYHGPHPNWYLMGSIHRESDILSRCNWAIRLEALTALDPKGELWVVERASHCLVGWMDHLLIAPHRAKSLYRVWLALDRAEEGYPMLDADRFSLMESEGPVLPGIGEE